MLKRIPVPAPNCQDGKKEKLGENHLLRQKSKELKMAATQPRTQPILLKGGKL